MIVVEGSSFSHILGVVRCLTEIIMLSSKLGAKASFVKESTSVLWAQRTCVISRLLKLNRSSLTLVKYIIIFSPLVWYSKLTCQTTNCKSLKMLKYFTPITHTIRCLTKRASYSTSLLEALNLNLNTYLILSHSDFGELRIKPMPQPLSYKDLLMSKV